VPSGQSGHVAVAVAMHVGLPPQSPNDGVPVAVTWSENWYLPGTIRQSSRLTDAAFQARFSRHGRCH
jgi:hypothetical protein